MDAVANVIGIVAVWSWVVSGRHRACGTKWVWAILSVACFGLAWTDIAAAQHGSHLAAGGLGIHDFSLRVRRTVAWQSWWFKSSVSILTLGSKIAPTFCDTVFARSFGVGGAADIFFLAFRSQSLPTTVWGRCTSAAVLPMYAERHQKDRPAGPIAAAGISAGIGLLTVLIALTGNGVVFTAPEGEHPHGRGVASNCVALRPDGLSGGVVGSRASGSRPIRPHGGSGHFKCGVGRWCSHGTR